jgi:branched-chain amino acid transport system substrate-binding protein
MKRKIYFLISVMLILTLALTGCGGGGASEETSGEGDTATDEPVIIGAVFPLTGSNALLGEESLRGAQMAIDEINAAGGLWGRQIELNVADAPDATAAQTEAERLVTKDGVQLVFGAYTSSIANVVSDVCARYEVPYFEFGAIGSAIMEKGYPYLWRTCAGAPDFGKGQAKYLTEVCLPVLG